MSSYLVAFVIGEFDYVEKRCPNNMPVRVYTPVGKQDMGIFSLDVSKLNVAKVVSNINFNLSHLC